jgi:hypothetical protein
MAPQQARLVLLTIAGLIALAATFASPLSASAEGAGLGLSIVSHR